MGKVILVSVLVIFSLLFLCGPGLGIGFGLLGGFIGLITGLLGITVGLVAGLSGATVGIVAALFSAAVPLIVIALVIAGIVCLLNAI